MNQDDLDPRIVAALRDVPAAADDLREAHLSAALGAVGNRGRGAALRPASFAAAAVLLLGAGFAAGQARDGDTMTTAAGSPASDTEAGVKGSTDALGDACPATGRTVLGEFTDRSLVRIIVLETAPARIVVLDALDCSTVAEVELP
jgi:hypothetical protein